MPDFCLVSDFVVSKSDGELHFIPSATLAKLYGVPLKDCVVHDYIPGYDCSQLYHLRPRENGDYDHL
jgi:hypothetical protein